MIDWTARLEELHEHCTGQELAVLIASRGWVGVFAVELAHSLLTRKVVGEMD